MKSEDNEGLKMKDAKSLVAFGLFWCIFEVAKAGPTCPTHCTCDYYSSVHTIECDSQDLHDFPPGIPTWTTSLSFDGNFLTALNLSAFNTSVYFEEFRIRYNKINRIIANDVKTSYPANRGACSDIVQIYPRLVEVNLRGNRLRKLPKCLSAIWPVLKILNLSENRFRSFRNLNFVNHLYYYDSIQELYIGRNQISRLTKGDLFSPANALRNVKILDLSENRISQLDSGVFLFLPQLKDLRLQDNQIMSIPNYAFLTSGQKIESILLHRNHINRISTKAFAGLALLSRLDLRGNNIHCLTAEFLSTCSTIDNVTMRQEPTNNTRTNRFRAIVDLVSLRQLRLKGNPWICDCNLLVAFGTSRFSAVVSSPTPKLSCNLPLRFRNYYFSHALRSLNCSTGE